MDNHKSEMMKRTGPGGFRCECCNEWFGKTKRILSKIARTALKRKLKKQLKYEIDY